MSTAKRVIRVGIAGQGRSGYSIHAACLREATERYRITAVADQIAERRRDAEREFGARAYSDYHELLRQGGFDVFVNALPSPLHVPATIEALQAGYHVVCEKPMAATVRELDRMETVARESGRLLAPFQNNRFQPFFIKIQEVLASGVLGQIISIRSEWGHFSRRWDWQTFQCNMGGALFNTGPHAIDQALMLFDATRMPEVFCRMSCHNTLGGDADDLCAISLHGPNAPLVEIILSGYNAYPYRDMYSISGTLGGLTASWDAVQWKYYDPAQAPKQEIWTPWSLNRQYPSEKLPWVEQSWKLDQAQVTASVGYTLKSLPSGPAMIYANLHDMLVHDAQPLITIAQIRRQIAVIEECHRQNPLPVKREQWLTSSPVAPRELAEQPPSVS